MNKNELLELTKAAAKDVALAQGSLKLWFRDAEFIGDEIYVYYTHYPGHKTIFYIEFEPLKYGSYEQMTAHKFYPTLKKAIKKSTLIEWTDEVAVEIRLRRLEDKVL